jgi:NADPH2:quinone reductase
MRAWQVQGAGEPIDVLHEVELEPPEPGPGQVRIRVTAAGMGLPDVFMCRGSYPLTPPLPFTSGQEACGTVTAVGEGVDLAIGARIMCVTMFWKGCGSFADECLVAADSAFPVPDGLSDAEAAGFWIPHLTGWTGLVDRGGLTPGDWLAVLGAAGGSGIAAVQLGRALGARVIAVVSDDERAAFCRELGAEATLNHRDAPLAPALRELTGGHGVDLIYDPVGGAVAEDAAGAMARHGRLLAVGFASGRWPQLATHDLVTSNTSLVGVFAGGYSRDELDDIHASLADLIADGRLRNAVTAEVQFDELPNALQRMADRSVIGKLVMVP